jgi:hypothetical protein
MRVANGKSAEVVKRAALPLTVCLLAIAYVPHKFGWTDAGMIAIAVPVAAIGVFAASYAWEHLGRNKPNSN